MVNRLYFSIEIEAEKTKIWQALWSDSGYRNWANVFFEGSYAVAENWDKGNHVLFLSPDKSGIYSLIETHIRNKIIAFKHIGKVLNGKEQALDDETKKWSGSTEIYKLSEGTKKHTLTIEIDVLDEHLDFMKTTFPKALEKMKSLSER